MSPHLYEGYTRCACDAPVLMIRGKAFHHDGINRHECSPITEKLAWMRRPLALYLQRCPACGAAIDFDGGLSYGFGTSVIHDCDRDAGVASTPPAPASPPDGEPSRPPPEPAAGGLTAERLWDD